MRRAGTRSLAQHAKGSLPQHYADLLLRTVLLTRLALNVINGAF